MRSFIAIDLHSSLKEALAKLQKEFKECGADVRWVKPEDIHLTLKFLGNIEEKIIDSIVSTVEGCCNRLTAFDLEVSGVGVFPNIKSPRVLWVGISGDGTLKELQQEIENRTASLGFKRESRRFVPHLTLGRFRSSRGKRTLIDKIALHKNNKLGLINVKSVILMRSDLGPEGAKHTKIAEVSLGRVDR